MTSVCVCGYASGYHDGAGRCPLCACGKLPDEHLPVTDPPSPSVTFGWSGPVAWPASPLTAFAVAGMAHVYRPRHELRCPGKLPSDAGRFPQLRRGSFREPDPDPEYRWRSDGVMVPIMAADEPAEVEDEVAIEPPQVPARYTAALEEIPPRAMPLGKAAAELGWQVDPWYYRAADGTENGLLLLQRGELRAYAQWARPEGASWKSAGAWAWRAGQWPAAVGVTRLAALIRDLGKP